MKVEAGIRPVPEAGDSFLISRVKDFSPMLMAVNALRVQGFFVKQDESQMIHAQGEDAAAKICLIFNSSEMKILMAAFEGKLHNPSQARHLEREDMLDDKVIEWLEGWSRINSAKKHEEWAKLYGDTHPDYKDKHQQAASEDRREAAKFVPEKEQDLLPGRVRELVHKLVISTLPK